MNHFHSDHLLSSEAVRVLGVLIEKEYSTPDYYPLTLNALVTGCNQKSNRHPVVTFSESTAMAALDELLRERLSGHASVSGSRAQKFRHAAAQRWNLERPALAVLASLLLRGPQTVGELRTHTSRMVTFESMGQVAEALTVLMEQENPLVAGLARRPGQKGERFGHLLSGELPEEDTASPIDSDAHGGSSTELEDIRERLTRLETEFEAFKRQFE
ncbi:MAG: DUF480 domain-containing protein [Bacteroidetes Order II. Incertae sedis bacterium]|jgi:uncharacterized protein|nr:DUF480 domain-containing protein [Bacteroidetes Order II. bacterium]MBT4603845.1 DUF480 domain-containing protein [Bacteroidetes Order II. bacterium]MBT5248986.1 DUF480 domain-containing protein [Bacteroidetes Order II. bacterium]MBT6200957.1 DUF480 domain-containing protein [Bacteroidetes Order II. bacterium]MBT6424010.1 DUF480 domain-containing protein [Bacteroidetes Order II. bacterium]